MVIRNDADLSGSSFEFRARKAVSSMNMISIWYSSNECPSKNEQLRARLQPVMNSSMSDETRNLISLEFMMNLYTISISKKHQPPWCRGSSNHSGCHVQNALATSDIWRPKRFPGSVLEERDIHSCFHCFCLFSQWDGKSWTLRPLREIIPASSPLSLWDPGSNFYPALYRAVAHSCIHQILQLLYTFWSWEEISWTICFQRQHTKCLHSLVGAPWTKQRDMANFPKSSKACCTSFCSLTKISASNGYANIQDIHENLDVNFPHQFAASISWPWPSPLLPGLGQGTQVAVNADQSWAQNGHRTLATWPRSSWRAPTAETAACPPSAQWRSQKASRLLYRRTHGLRNTTIAYDTCSPIFGTWYNMQYPPVNLWTLETPKSNESNVFPEPTHRGGKYTLAPLRNA